MFSGRPSIGGWGVGAPLATPPLRSRRVDCMCNAENGIAKVQMRNADLGRGTFLGGGGSDEDSEGGEEGEREVCACSVLERLRAREQWTRIRTGSRGTERRLGERGWN